MAVGLWLAGPGKLRSGRNGLAVADADAAAFAVQPNDCGMAAENLCVRGRGEALRRRAWVIGVFDGVANAHLGVPSINFLLWRDAFISERSSESVTKSHVCSLLGLYGCPTQAVAQVGFQ